MRRETKSAEAFKSAIFITFPGTCKKALSHYQSCFGGILELDLFDSVLDDYQDNPVISGLLKSNQIHIYGSDLGHNEGRILGNYMSIFLLCENSLTRKGIIEKLTCKQPLLHETPRLIEIIDIFDVRWTLALQ